MEGAVEYKTGVGGDRTEQSLSCLGSHLCKSQGTVCQVPFVPLSLPRSWAEVKPHHPGESYSRKEMVVMRATSCSWTGGRPWVLSMRRAWVEEAQLEMSPW